MKTRVLRVLFVLVSLAAAVLLGGPATTLAEESRQDTGMIQCVAASRDALMMLEFPADGGAVTGEYLVSYTAHDSSPLFDESGAWEYYDEDRTISQSVQFSGFYSGGEEGSFTDLRVRGSGTAYIDNLGDDRFDRSYRAEIDSPATATWGLGSSLALDGITAVFELVSINTNDIANTEWLDPQGFGFPEPTMVCKPATRPQTPQDVACFITTDPPELGERDTSFQANIAVTGLDAEADLSYVWVFGGVDLGYVMSEDQNPTITWDLTVFSPGYYTLSATVSDGAFTACCAKHFAIGDVPPNSPPECLSVDVVPLPPPAGLPVLGAAVAARDADGDPLEYNFQLYRGYGMAAEGTFQSADNYVFSVAGGLQPGPYTVAVQLMDGNYYTTCTYQLIVPGFPGGDGAGCGPVGIMYLDDNSIEPNWVAIDAAIEAALAQGGAEYSLIVSHRQRLIDQFGEDGFEQIDGLLKNMRSIAETCPFVLIVGDDDVVPVPVLPNPAPDGDMLFTDDPYGDTDHDDLTIPDIPVARIPDGDSLDLVLTQLSPSDTVPEGGDLTISSTDWPYIGQLTSRAFGPDRNLLWSLPTTYIDLDPSQVGVRWDFLSLHGSQSYGGAWWGEKPTFPVAFTVAEAESQGLVLGGACYGAYTMGRTPEDTIALAFLASGSRAFVGTRGLVTHPPERDVLSREAAVFQLAFWEALARGSAPLDAFMEGKAQMAAKVRSRSGSCTEQRMLHDFAYYGKP